jgi:hypothetical protein
MIVGRSIGSGQDQQAGRGPHRQEIHRAQPADPRHPEHAEADAARMAFAGVAKHADSDYVKSSIPVGDLADPIDVWSEEQNGLCIGMRVIGGEWRIGGEVKVELWVCNPGNKDVKFQSTGRRDIGLRVFMKDADAKEREATIAPFDSIPTANRHALPPGHVFRAKEFKVLLSPPRAKDGTLRDPTPEPWFGLTVGDYKFRCELALPGFSTTGRDGKQFSPAEGEWSGRLATGELNVTVIAADAP